MTEFLPVSKEEILTLGWNQPDFVMVGGDSYVDHPSFGLAIISRLLAAQGFQVAILAQPAFDHSRDFCRFGRPKYGFLITAGNIDSMVAHYTAAKRRRSDDAYTAGNKAGRRPDRAVTVYSRLAKAAYPDCPVIIGGLEASLRRFAHYDYWADQVMPSVLLESGADLLIYGMGEHQVAAIAQSLAAGQGLAAVADIPGICRMVEGEGEHTDLLKGKEGRPAYLLCPSFMQVSTDKKAYAAAALLQVTEQDHLRGRGLVQEQAPGRYLVQNPPAAPLTRQELDRVFALPYARMYHPMYEPLGGVKAIEEVEFSLIHNRGCFGGCHFCAISLHQGRQVTSRSHQSVLQEARGFLHNPRFKGYIHDVGGPTANFRQAACAKQQSKGTCPQRLCLTPRPCSSLMVDHTDYLALLRALRQLPGVKKVFIRSGLRYDYLLLEKNDQFLAELCRHHISGQLKIAPEHSAPKVLALMGKPSVETFTEFAKRYYAMTKEVGKEQYLVPYLMSSHPGATLQDAIDLALFLKKNRLRPEQVQDFYPTPGTISTAMFYTGLNPYTMKPVYVPRSPEEKRQQRLLLQYYKKEHQRDIIRILVAQGREELIGYGKGHLVAPDRAYLYGGKNAAAKKSQGKAVAAAKGRQPAESKGIAGRKQPAGPKQRTATNPPRRPGAGGNY